MTEAVWHDMECGSYAADLTLWDELVGEAPRDVLDLGCGTGRVSVRLARRGHRVTGIDLEPAFLEEAMRRAQAWKVTLDTVAADARSFDLGRPFDLVLAPMQLVQLFHGSEERMGMLKAAAAHLRPGGLFAAALMNLEGEGVGDEYIPPGPDMRDVDGWVYSSQPVAVRPLDGGSAISLDRVRTIVAPDGARTSEPSEIRLELLSPDQYEEEIAAVGLVLAGRRLVAPTEDHVGSVVVLATAPGESAVSDATLRVMWLYPDHMNIYADRGNIILLERRCEWRGIGFELGTAGPGEPVDASAHDLFYIGGGQDRDQALVARDLVETKREALAGALRSGASMLAVCGGYQLLGHSYELGDESLPGLGLVDLRTVREPGERLIGNVVIDADLGDGPRRLAGFENHGGRTYLGADEQPLGQVVSGFGNNGKDGAEGVRRGRLIGTYLHGPLLPKNAWLADVLIGWALERRLGTAPDLEPLDDRLEEAAHESAVRAALG